MSKSLWEKYFQNSCWVRPQGNQYPPCVNRSLFAPWIRSITTGNFYIIVSPWFLDQYPSLIASTDSIEYIFVGFTWFRRRVVFNICLFSYQYYQVLKFSSSMWNWVITQYVDRSHSNILCTLSYSSLHLRFTNNVRNSPDHLGRSSYFLLGGVCRLFSQPIGGATKSQISIWFLSRGFAITIFILHDILLLSLPVSGENRGLRCLVNRSWPSMHTI